MILFVFILHIYILLQWLSNRGVATSQTEALTSAPLRGRGKAVNPFAWIIAGVCLDSAPAAAASLGFQNPHTRLHSAPHTVETLKIVIRTTSNFTNAKLEVVAITTMSVYMASGA